MVIEQIQHQLERLVPIHSVYRHDRERQPDRARAGLIKVAGKGEKHVEAQRLAETFHAQIIDSSTGHFIFEITGEQARIEQFIAKLQPLGLVEVARTGLAAITRGPERM